MNTLHILIGLFFSLCPSHPSSTAHYDLDRKDPESVVGAVFYAAQSDDYAILEDLAAPKGDGDTRRLAALAKLHSRAPNAPETLKKIKAFKHFFEKGQLTGEVQYWSTEDGTRMAQVGFLFGPDGQKNECMQLVERKKHWYLFSF